MLTVAQLIEKLKELPQDLIVVAGTCEAAPITDVSVCSVDEHDDYILDEDPDFYGRKVVAFSEGPW